MKVAAVFAVASLVITATNLLLTFSVVLSEKRLDTIISRFGENGTPAGNSPAAGATEGERKETET